MVPEETVEELDLREYLEVVRRRKMIIVLSFLIVVGLALAVSYLQTPRYASEAKILIRPRGTGGVFTQPNQQLGVNSDRALQTEIEVIKSEPVAELVRQEIGEAPAVVVRPIGRTDVVTIRAESTDAARSAEIANAYGNAYTEFRRKQVVGEFAATSEEIQTKITDLNRQLDNLGTQLAAAPACVSPAATPELCTQRTSIQQTIDSRRTTLLSQLGVFQQRMDQLQVDSGLTAGNVEIVAPASVPAEPFAPTPARNGVLGGVLGLMLGVGLAFLREHFDDSVKSKEDLERALPGVGVLALIPLIPDWKAREQSKLVSLSDPTSPAAEAYRMLRTSIQFLGIDRDVRLVQVASASAQEGKTTTMANLAVAFASSGLRTVAVCCDLRRPRLHDFFGLDNAVGFTSVLLGNVPLAKALQPVANQERLLVLASGPLPPNPAELLSSTRTADLFRNLASQADVVLIDSPPVLPVTDSLVLSQRADVTVLVASASTTTRGAARRAAEMLRQVDASLVGAVLNGVNTTSGYVDYGSRYYVRPWSQNGAAGNGKARSVKVRGRGRDRASPG